MRERAHCRVCGCTDTHPCDPPCEWVDDHRDLCTACRAYRNDGGPA